MQRQPAHRKAGTNRWPVAAAVLAAVVVLGGGATGLVWVAHSMDPAAIAPPTRNVAVPFDLVATTPEGGTTPVPSATTITATFSAPIGTSSPMPTLAPAVPGRWSLVSPSELEFVPSAPLVPGASELVTIPGGTDGMMSAQGVRLASSHTLSFSVAPGSVLRLQQLLAELGYLPLNFTPTAPLTSLTQEADVQQGTFGWRWANQPSFLTSLWTAGQMNVITKGAVMDFQDQHGLTTDGVAGPQVWTDLLNDAASGHADANPYRYVYVSEGSPESVTVYQDGQVDYKTLANTGVAGAETARGTFTVYERFTSTTMTGTNLDGSRYSDPGVPWVSYFNGGDALHGFDRPGYGYPQSLGCVEMLPSNAAVVYPLTPIGTLVTVGA